MSASRPGPVPAHRLRREADEPMARIDLGQMRYLDAWAVQRELVAERQAGRGTDTLLLVEHPPVYTLGKRADPTNVLLDAATLAAEGIEVVEVDRGGDVTYHGPGQLVGYPVLVLAGVRTVVDYVRALEEVLIVALAELGVTGTRIEHLTGVWVDGAKIAAIGVRVASGGVTSHGFALNVAPDLGHFAGIIPCGISDRAVCSLSELGVTAGMATVADTVAAAFAQVFAATLLVTPRSRSQPAGTVLPPPAPHPKAC